MEKRILHINKSDRTGGAAVAALRLVNAQRGSGFQADMLVENKQTEHSFVHAALPKGRLSKWKSFANFVIERLYFFPFEANKSIRFAFSPAKAGTRICDNENVQATDILHFHWFNQGYLSLNEFKRLLAMKKPVVWTLHDMWAFTGGCHYSSECTRYEEACGNCAYLKRPSDADLSYLTLQNKGFISSQKQFCIVTCSEWLAKMARASSLLRGVKVVSIPNPINTDHFTPRSKRITKEALGLSPNKPVLLFGAANIEDKRKGFKFLKAALAALQNHTREKGLQLIFFGKAEHINFSDFGLPYRHFPFADTKLVVQLYNAADCMVIPSLQDNLPNTIMESLASGTPVVAFETGGIPEMIQHLETGYLVPLRNTEELAEGIRWALTTGEKEQQAARKFVMENYAQEVVAKKYAEVYDDLFTEISE